MNHGKRERAIHEFFMSFAHNEAGAPPSVGSENGVEDDARGEDQAD
jgi:hypothetical protein